jgi:hypothetical protein
VIAKAQKFLLSCLDPQGTVSFGRVMAAFMAFFVAGWDLSGTYMAWQLNHLPGNHYSLYPDGTVIAAQAALIGTFYGITKLSTQGAATWADPEKTPTTTSPDKN